MTLENRTRLGHYEILGPLGAGGMGEVYRARDHRLGREVAVKVLPQEVAASPDRLARFEVEARTVARLSHPNIVTLHSVEDEAGVRFITMELVDGQTLSTLATPGGLPLARLLEIAIPLTDALVAAHERGVVHRDLKPGNVMVTRDGRVKVLDFGLARMTALDPARQLSVTTLEESVSGQGVIGTVPYMSPEQLRGEDVDARSDLFALGIILHELATGRKPFPGASRAEVTSSILRDPPPSLARADLPDDFERIVGRCLEKNPRERAQSALDISNDLRRIRKAMERGGLPEGLQPLPLASIAVLPFVNRSASADDEYFSDGLADELLNVLSKIKGLRVIARSSAFMFKGKQVSISDIGQALDVATVLEGSVRKAGSRVRIGVQLVNVTDSSQLWSETYDRTLDDIFAVQDDIAHAVVKELRSTLLGQEPDSDASGVAKADVARAAKGRGTDPEAHRLFLLARHAMERGSREGLAEGLQDLKEALRRDPESAGAWVALAMGFGTEADMGWVPVAEGYIRSREAVERALELEPDMPEGHAHLGRIRMLHDWDWEGARQSFSRALDLAPGNAAALRGSGALAMSTGRLDEAIAQLRDAVKRDPLTTAAYIALGMSLLAADRASEAEAAYRKALEVAPRRGGSNAPLAMALLAQGRGREALEQAEQESHPGYRLWALAMVHHALGNRDEADRAVHEIEAFADGGSFQIAEVHGARGEVDDAFAWLERAFAQRDGGVAGVKASVHLRSLHGDPRWSSFLKRMGLTR
jgi:serine/threonine-protein kinase